MDDELYFRKIEGSVEEHRAERRLDDELDFEQTQKFFRNSVALRGGREDWIRMKSEVFSAKSAAYPLLYIVCCVIRRPSFFFFVAET